MNSRITNKFYPVTADSPEVVNFLNNLRRRYDGFQSKWLPEAHARMERVFRVEKRGDNQLAVVVYDRHRDGSKQYPDCLLLLVDKRNGDILTNDGWEAAVSSVFVEGGMHNLNELGIPIVRGVRGHY